jgi:maleate cis-trans isomerase
MFGWRKRIGYIAPTVMEVVPYELYRFAPNGVGLVGVTCNIDGFEPQEFEKGLSQVSQAASYLGSRGVDFIIHGGGPLVVKRGKGFEETIVREIETVSKRPATTGVRAGMEALRHVGARRVAMASPYPKAQDEAMAGYLAAHGFEMTLVEGWDIGFKELQNVAPSAIYRFASGVLARAKALAAGCDALYLPCPQWQAAQIVDVLEKDSGLPVIAYTHATFFAAFKTLGLRDPIHGHGRLLASLADAAR